MDMRDTLARKPWLDDPDPLEGLILHEIGVPMAGTPSAIEAQAPSDRTREVAK